MIGVDDPTADHWRKWGVNDTGTRVHLYTNRCRGCCLDQALHDRRIVPQSLCRQSWTPWPGNPVDDPAVPRCKTCQRLQAAWAADELSRLYQEEGL